MHNLLAPSLPHHLFAVFTCHWLLGQCKVVTAFLSNIVFSISKSNFITYNIPLYNTIYIKIYIFLPFYLNNIFLLFLNNFLSLLSLVSLSSIQGRSQKFLFGGAKCNANIFIKTTSTHIYIHICTFFYYIYTLFIW